MTLMPSRKAKAKAKAHHSVTIARALDIMRGNVAQQKAQERQVQAPNVTYAKARGTQERSVPVKEGASTRKKARAKTKEKDRDNGEKDRDNGEEKEKEKVRARARARECMRWMIGGDQGKHSGAHS